MRYVPFGPGATTAPAIVIGCMRFDQTSVAELTHFIHTALELGVTVFDHADIYGGGQCEALFGEAMAKDPSLHRDELFIQSKCGIRDGEYDLSKEWILSSVEGSLTRLQTDYLDLLLLHRPDALMVPDEVAEAFDELERTGKVRQFGVSNFKSSQVELLSATVRQPLVVNQLRFGLAASSLVANGLQVNMEVPGAVERDGSVLDYARTHGMTIQAWSPMRAEATHRTFIGDRERYATLNDVLETIARDHGTSPTAIAAAWVLRHPASMQLVSGSTRESRLREVVSACAVELSREEWYRLYRAAGNPLP